MVKSLSVRDKKKLLDYQSSRIPGFEVLIDNVWDVHNVSAVLRSADGLGVSKVWLYYTHNEFPDLSKHGKKSSSSASKWVSLEKVLDIKEFLDKKKSEGFTIIVADYNLENSSDNTNLLNYSFPDKTLLILGAEHHGISPEIKALADVSLFIPMVGLVKSYNISVAAGVLFYEFFKQKNS